MSFLNFLGWAIMVVAAVMIFLSFWIPPSVFDPMKAALPAGILIALAGNLFAQARSSRDSTEKRSQFYLNSCILAYEGNQSQGMNFSRAT